MSFFLFFAVFIYASSHTTHISIKERKCYALKSRETITHNWVVVYSGAKLLEAGCGNNHTSPAQVLGKIKIFVIKNTLSATQYNINTQTFPYLFQNTPHISFFLSLSPLRFPSLFFPLLGASPFSLFPIFPSLSFQHVLLVGCFMFPQSSITTDHRQNIILLEYWFVVLSFGTLMLNIEIETLICGSRFWYFIIETL